MSGILVFVWESCLCGERNLGERVNETGGGDVESRPMRHLAATADRVDRWIGRQMVPGLSQTRVNSARDRRVALAAIGRYLKDQYDAAATPIPARLSALVEQFKAQG